MKYALITETQIKVLRDTLVFWCIPLRDTNFHEALAIIQSLKPSEPAAYRCEVNKTHTMFYVASEGKPPPEDAYDEGTLIPLFALGESNE